jgi:hypothetical protein
VAPDQQRVDRVRRQGHRRRRPEVDHKPVELH